MCRCLPAPVLPSHCGPLLGVPMGKVNTRRAFHSPSGSTRGPGRPLPAQRGRSPATGRNTRSKERRQSRGEGQAWAAIWPLRTPDKHFPRTMGTPIPHSIFWTHPPLLAGVSLSTFHALICYQFINPSTQPVFVKYLPYARYGRVRQLLPSIIGGGDR